MVVMMVMVMVVVMVMVMVMVMMMVMGPLLSLLTFTAQGCHQSSYRAIDIVHHGRVGPSVMRVRNERKFLKCIRHHLQWGVDAMCGMEGQHRAILVCVVR